MMQIFDFTKLEEGDQITVKDGTYSYTKKFKKSKPKCKKCSFCDRFSDDYCICCIPCEGGVWKDVTGTVKEHTKGAHEMTLYLAVFVSGVFIGILCGWIVTMVYFILKEYTK